MNNIQKNFKAKSALRRGHGGRVSGPGGPTDDKVGPVMLSDEEYVLPADTVKAVGVKNLDKLRDATHKYDEKPDWDMDMDDELPLNGLRDGGQREAMRAITHMSDGSRRMGDNPERAAMMQESYDQPVTSGEPVQHTPLPLPAQPHARDTNPANAFMYENPLGDMIDDLRERLPGLRDGGSRRQYSAGVAPAFDREKYVAMGKAMQQDRAPRRQYSTGTKPDFEIPQAEPRGLRRQYGSMQRMADGGRVLSPEELLRQRTVGVAAPSAPPTVVPPTSPIATAPGGNTLPATQNSSAPMRTGTAPYVERDMGRAQVVGDGKPRITGPAAGPSKLVTGAKWLGKGLGLTGAGLAGYDMYENGVNPSNSFDMATSAGMMMNNPWIKGGSMLAAGAKGLYGLIPDDVRDSMRGGPEDAGINFAMPPVGSKPADTQPVGVMAPKDPNALSDFAGRITKDALSRPGGSALRSQDRPMYAPTPNGLAPNTVRTTPVAPKKGYQTEQLTKLGVSPEVQNGPSLPQGPATLQSYGSKDYQNLGTYGGDANLYGRAGDASKPGRINDFVGVGATATPQSALRGNTLSSNDAQVQRGRELLAQDKARAAGGRDPNKLYIGTADGELGSMEQRFGAARRQVMQDFGGAGQQAQRNRALQNIAQQEAAAINERDTTQTTAETARMGQGALERTAAGRDATDVRVAEIGADTSRRTLAYNAAAKQAELAATASKSRTAAEEKGFERQNKMIDTMFTAADPETGEAKLDVNGANKLRNFVAQTAAETGVDPVKGFMELGPQDQAQLLQELRTAMEVAETAGSTTGGVDPVSELRKSRFGDIGFGAGGISPAEYIYQRMPYTDPNIYKTESGAVGNVADLANEDGSRNLRRLNIVNADLRRAGKQ